MIRQNGFLKKVFYFLNSKDFPQFYSTHKSSRSIKIRYQNGTTTQCLKSASSFVEPKTDICQQKLDWRQNFEILYNMQKLYILVLNGPQTNQNSSIGNSLHNHIICFFSVLWLSKLESLHRTVARTNQYSGHVPMLFVNPTHKNVSSVPHILLNCHLSRYFGSTHLTQLGSTLLSLAQLWLNLAKEYWARHETQKHY